MSVQNIDKDKSGEDRLKAAKTDYDKLAERMKPFIKKREIKTNSTSGKWIACE